MKKIFIVLLALFCFTNLFAGTTYYVLLTGNDNNTGTAPTSGSAFRTVYKASQVASSGDIINIGAGVFVESNIINIAAGVTVSGAGGNPNNNSGGTEIQYSGGSTDLFFRLVSSSLNSTGQTISNIKFNGNYQSAYRGMLVKNRSNVTIDHCVFVLFNSEGVLINASIGTLVDNDIVSNCYFLHTSQRYTPSSSSEGTTGANLEVGMTTNCKVFNNVFDEIPSDVKNTYGYNGTWGFINSHGDQINNWANEYSPSNNYSTGCFGWKIYNNVFHRPQDEMYPFGAWTYNSGSFSFATVPGTTLNPTGDQWVFSLELWRIYAESEIYNNTFDYGLIDLCGFSKKTVIGPQNGTYSCNIHDNTFSIPSQTYAYEGSGIDLETGANDASLIGQEEDCNIYNNTLINVPNFISIDFYFDNNGYFTESGFSAKNINVYKNTLINCGATSNTLNGGNNTAMNGTLFDVITESQSNNKVDNIHIFNNTMYNNSSYHVTNPIDWNVSPNTNSNFSITNNIFYGQYNDGSALAYIHGSGSISGLSINNNDYYNISGTNLLYSLGGVTASSANYANNIAVNPSFSNAPSNLLPTNSSVTNGGTDLGIGMGNMIGAVGAGVTITVSAGSTQTINTRTITLAVSGTTSGGTAPYTYSWAQTTTSPLAGDFVNGINTGSSVTFEQMINGVYQFTVTATDANGNTGTSSVQITVNQSGGGGSSSLLNGLVSYYKLDEPSNSNTAIDQLGTNPLSNSTATEGALGKINTGYSFNGSSAYASNSTLNSSLALTTTGTVSAWVYPTNISGGAMSHGGVVVGKGNTSSDGYGYSLGFLYGNPCCQLYGELAAVPGQTPQQTDQISYGNTMSVISNNTWHMITMTWDGTHVNLYLDGASVTAAVAQTYNPISNIYPFTIGKMGFTGAGGYFQGNIDEVGVWNRALTAGEVQSLYGNGNGLSYNFGGISLTVIKAASLFF